MVRGTPVYLDGYPELDYALALPDDTQTIRRCVFFRRSVGSLTTATCIYMGTQVIHNKKDPVGRYGCKLLYAGRLSPNVYKLPFNPPQREKYSHLS